MRKKDSNKGGNSWLIRMIIFLGFVALIFISLAIYKETYRKKQVQKEIDTLKEEADRIQGANSRLADKLAYLQGRDYQEKEIRDKLNLQNPDENVVIIKPNSTKKIEERKNSEAPTQELVVKTSNPEKWWNYFFK
ncbi:MAG: septum formation initiator family protein [Candidatus Moraniibacteriota bacterium]